MAIISEELGFSVYFCPCSPWLYCRERFYIARKCEDPFGSLLAIGISSMIAIKRVLIWAVFQVSFRSLGSHFRLSATGILYHFTEWMYGNIAEYQHVY